MVQQPQMLHILERIFFCKTRYWYLAGVKDAKILWGAGLRITAYEKVKCSKIGLFIQTAI